MKTSLFTWNAALALSLAVAGCSRQAPPPASTAHVVVAEIRAPNVGPGTQIDMVVPDAQDGQSNHNPPGSVEVFSTEATAEYATTTNPCSARAVYVPVTVKSYATETLSNTMIEFTSVTPVSHTVCNPQPGTKPAGATGRVIVYGDLTGSTASDGSAPGSAASVTWSFDYETASPFSFAARVWADVNPAPPSSPSPAPGSAFCAPGTCGASLGTLPVVLQWTGSTPAGHVEIWGDAAFATSLIEAADVVGVGSNGTYAYSYTVSSTSPGQRWWRAVNRFTGSGGSTVNGTFSTGGMYYVDAAPSDVKTYLWADWWVWPVPAIICPLSASDLVEVATTTYVSHHGYEHVVLDAKSFAPAVDFYSWGWREPDGLYKPHPRADPFLYMFLTCFGDLVETRLVGPPEFGLGTRIPEVNLWDPVVADTVFGWKVCTQYGALGSTATQGACSEMTLPFNR